MSEKAPLDFESAWTSWFASSVRHDLQEGIATELERTSGIFDVQDGTHAKWNGKRLGVLTVFDTDEVIALLCAWEEAENKLVERLVKRLHLRPGTTFTSPFRDGTAKPRGEL